MVTRSEPTAPHAAKLAVFRSNQLKNRRSEVTTPRCESERYAIATPEDRKTGSFGALRGVTSVRPCDLEAGGGDRGQGIAVDVTPAGKPARKRISAGEQAHLTSVGSARMRWTPLPSTRSCSMQRRNSVAKPSSTFRGTDPDLSPIASIAAAVGRRPTQPTVNALCLSVSRSCYKF